MKVALVYDRVNKWGGAERVLLSLHAIWPNAPLFTAVYDKNRAPWADVFDVRTSFLQSIPFAKNHHEWLAWITPIAFETFRFDEFDVVITVTSAEAKSIITKPGCVHICYCLTPTRYLWSAASEYQRHGIAGYLLRKFSKTLQRWDLVSASRPDYYLAISQRVKKRIETYYHRTVSDVIYPPIDPKKFIRRHDLQNENKRDAYFLTVSRLVSYKRLDIVINAFNALGLPLVIIGDGKMKRELKQMAKTNIRFVDTYLTDSELLLYYEGCRAFVFAGDEDFGLAALEAQSMGIPVIAYRKSGISEIVKDSITGVLFDEQSQESLIAALHAFAGQQFSGEACRKQAEKMSEKAFIRSMKEFVAEVTNKQS